MTRYVELCSFSVKHEYYGADRPPITLSLTPESSEILSRAKCQFKISDGNAGILCEVADLQESATGGHTALQLLAEQQPEALIEIHLSAQDPYHYNYTVPVFDAVENSAPADSSPNNDTDHVVNNQSSIQLAITPAELKAVQKIRLLDAEGTETFDPEQARQSFATPVFKIRSGEISEQTDDSLEYWKSSAQAIARPLCVLQISLNELFTHLKEGGETARPIEIVTIFSSQEVYWRYNLMSVGDDEINDVEIVDRQAEIPFIRLAEALINGVMATRFISSQTIPLRARPSQQFEVHGQVSKDGRIRQIRKLLPAADSRGNTPLEKPDKNFVSAENNDQSTTFVADIYVY
ncbi:MAG: hypothetical protein AAF404_04595 [Pseudomonadota bacterium]